MQIKEFFGDDNFRRAVVLVFGGVFSIDFYQKGKYINTTYLGVHSNINEACDLAEDYVLGIKS
jgi:hypothetical protein